MASRDPFNLLGMENPSYGCGNPPLVQQMMAVCRDLVGANAQRFAVSQIIRREMRDREYKNAKPNIKESMGGLRDMLDVMVIYKGLEGMPQTSVFDIIGGIYDKLITDAAPEDRQHLTSQRASLMDSYYWLMNLRIRLDLELGRQDKTLPEGADLMRFARLLGYRARGDKDAVEHFQHSFENHTKRMRNITDQLIKEAYKRHPGLKDAETEVREFLEAESKRLHAEEELQLKMEGFHGGVT
jgi:UTP:GlnB (protein PII) uridylyltransferase